MFRIAAFLMGLFFLIGLISGCHDYQSSQIEYVPIQESSHGYNPVDVAFGYGIHAYEVALCNTPTHYYLGLAENTTMHQEANAAAISVCMAKYASASASELGACRGGVIYARQMLESK